MPHLNDVLRLAADPGFSFADEFTLGLIGFGIALFAGVGALSHQHERAFSASIIYLLLGLVAAGALSVLEVAPIDHVADATLLEHITELALIVAVFTSGLSITAVDLARVAPGRRIDRGRDAAVDRGGRALWGACDGPVAGGAIILGAILAPTDPSRRATWA